MAIESEQNTNNNNQQLTLKIAKIFDESKTSYATHNRKLKQLSILKSSSSSSSSSHFFSSFCNSLLPLFNFHRRTASADRIVRFVSVFATLKHAIVNSADGDGDTFLEDFLGFLLPALSSANKTVRFRSSQIISEVIMRLPDDAEVSDELWDQVIDNMLTRIEDKIPIVRTFAIRALSRFVNDSENRDILESFLQALNSEQNADVRKTIVLSLPPSTATSEVIIGCTLDVSESVRKAAYFVLANKFPLQSLSIKLRTLILQRGLSDRSPLVVKECLKLMKDEWLSKCCNGDPIELLKYLDVETYESVGISVMSALLDAGMVKLDGNQRMQQFRKSIDDGDADYCNRGLLLLEPESALYWRVVCQNLQTVAQEKGSEAAATMGTEATVYAAEASDSNDLLEKVLPATVSDYVDLVEAHINAGSNYHFVSRQLLLLGALLDFSDSTVRKTASIFVQDLLRRPVEYEIGSDENRLVIGDGINLGGDRDWANAVAELVKKVHAADGEFEEVILGVVDELSKPCRERSADFLEWMHCLAVISLLLENTKSFRYLQGKTIEPIELLTAVLLPAAKHVNLDVQRVAVKCIGLYGLLERKPCEEVVKQLAFSFLKGPTPISLFGGKALIDLVMWHGPEEVNRAVEKNFLSQAQENGIQLPVGYVLCENSGDFNVEVLKLLYFGLEDDFFSNTSNVEENEFVQAALGEGFAKILLLSENYPSIPSSLHSLILAKLVSMYFSEENHELERLKQCLSVFFEHYPSLSANHKKHLSKAFVSVVRSMWPGIDGNQGGSSVMIAAMRKRAVQASRFMLQMMQSMLYQKDVNDDKGDSPKDCEGTIEDSDEFEIGEEGLAIRIATEVVAFGAKKTSAEKSYILALCKTLVLLHFRASEQGAIRLMRLLLSHVVDAVSSDKELVKELTNLAKNLKSLDRNPDEELSRDQANILMERLGLSYNVDEDHSNEVPPTPVSRATRPTRARRRVREEDSSSDEEEPPGSIASTGFLPSARSQRASKTAALTKMTAGRSACIAGDDIEEEEESDLTSEEESDDSNSST